MSIFLDAGNNGKSGLSIAFPQITDQLPMPTTHPITLQHQSDKLKVENSITFPHSEPKSVTHMMENIDNSPASR